MVVLIAMLVAHANGVNIPEIAWLCWGIYGAGKVLEMFTKKK